MPIDPFAPFTAADTDTWLRMYLEAVDRHHKNLDALVSTIALGGDLKAVVHCVVDWLDGMDALADANHEQLRRAWIAAGGTLEDFPVTVVWSAIGTTAVVTDFPEGEPS